MMALIGSFTDRSVRAQHTRRYLRLTLAGIKHIENTRIQICYWKKGEKKDNKRIHSQTKSIHCNMNAMFAHAAAKLQITFTHLKLCNHTCIRTHTHA